MTLKENNTHEAIKNVINGKIDIYIKGLTLEDGYSFDAEYLFSIDGSQIDDLEAIFDRFDEENRINRAEFYQEM
jgi:hypothetical protein